MSSRFPPTSSGESRYSRDRSQPRSTDRRPSAVHGDGLSASRTGEPGYRSTDTHSYSGRGRELAREPPRGPKADLVGPRGGFIPRGRGYLGRGDARDRDARDFSRDDSFARRGRGQDWGARDRFDGRDRRASPPGRDRSRSPLSRDFRDSRDTRDFAPRDDSRRDSRETPLSATSSTSDSFPFRGRGGFRGRGRGLFPEEHEDLGPRSRSRDRDWERQMREDRDRERDLETSRRDDDLRKERDDREREDRFRREPPPFRPNSRNSTGGVPTPINSRSTSSTLIHQGNLDRIQQTYKDARDLPLEQRSKPLSSNPDGRLANTDRDLDRGDQHARRLDSDRFEQRTASPPPQAPPVPAFGSIPNRAPAVHHDTQVKQESPRPSPSVHPSRLNLMDVAREAPSAPKAHILSGAPTAPKAQQALERRRSNDNFEPTKRLLDNDVTRSGPNRQSAGAPANPITKEVAFEQVRSISKRFSQTRADHDSSARPAMPSVSGPSDPAQPSVRKAVEEQGRNGNVLSSANPASSVRLPAGDLSSQTSPMKIPTGPRAERTAASIRQPAPQIRGPPIRPPPIMQRPQGRSATRVWVNPNLPQHTPRGPSIMNSVQPSIMNTVPTKRDYLGDEKGRTRPTSAESTETTSAAMRRSSALTARVPGDASADRLNKSPRSTDDLPGGPAELRKASISDFKPRMMAPEKLKDEESDEAAADDGEMEYDEEDFAKDERKFDREMQALEAKRPPSPRSDPVLLELLEEVDALGSALEEKTKSGSADGSVPIESANLGLPSPKIEESDRMDIKIDDSQPQLHVKIRPQTPSVDSLPFLISGPPTPFSDITDLQEDLDRLETVNTLLIERLRIEHDSWEAQKVEDRDTFARLYKHWRNEVEDFEDQRRAEEAMTVSPSAENVSLPVPVPPAVGRRGKIISELDMEEVLRVSQETAAKEERVRREREAPAYIPLETFNPEREAVIPDMLSSYEVKASMFDDMNNYVDQKRALNVLGFFPKQDDFTPAEHEIFLYQFMLNPKKFGMIADAIDGRDYQDCVQHYYHTKLSVKYKEAAFCKTRKGRKLVTQLRNAQMRPKSNALMLAYDGVMDYETTNVALTEKGRPRRAAAPTFGDTADAEVATPMVTPVRRNAGAGKENANPNLSSEKATKQRTRTVPAKEKVGRKGRAPLLAAAPVPAPQKAVPESAKDPSKEPPFGNEQRMEDFEGAQVLTGLTSGQQYPVNVSQQGLIEGWPTNQTASIAFDQMTKNVQPSILEQPPAPPPRNSGTPATSSYWSVPEQQDFYNLLRYFGTDWHSIASSMKTKTHTMIKNFYNRKIQDGDVGKTLEADTQRVDEMRRKGEDMGPLPAPTPTEKRRYGNTSREPQRPLAPNMETVELVRSSPVPRNHPTKSQPLSHFRLTPNRLTAKASAEEGAAAVSSQMLAQGRDSLANRVTIPLHSKGSQQSQGPRVGTFTEERPRSWKPQTIENTDHQHQQQQQTQRQQQQLQVQQQQLQARQLLEQEQQERQQLLRQEAEDQMHHQRIKQPEIEKAPQQHQQHGQNRISNPLHTSLYGPSAGPPRLAPSQPIELEIDEKSRSIMQNRQQQQQQQAQKQQQQHAQQQVQQAVPQPPLQQIQQRQPQIDTSSPMRRIGSGPYGTVSTQFTPSHSPSSASLLVPPTSPPAETLRPSSVPVTTSVQPPPREAPKKSNILSLLNNDPAEPQPRKKQSDRGPAAPTPPPATSAPVYQPTHQAPMLQQLQKREVASEAVPQLQQQQRQSFNQQAQQPQQQGPQARELGRNWSTMVQRPWMEERGAQSQSSISPQAQTGYLPTSSRPAFQALQRNHALSPSFSHSRNSSYTSLHSQQHQPAQSHRQQQHQPQAQPQVQHLSIPSTPAEPNIRPSPYASINPPQSQHQQQQQSQNLRLVLQQQQQQQREQQLDARGIIRSSDHHPRQELDEAARRQQEVMHQQHSEALRIQQQEALRQQEAVRARRGFDAQHENMLRREQEKAIIREAEERERERRAGYSGTFYHSSDVAGMQGRGLGGGGGYEERR